jgi:hypothetical protein
MVRILLASALLMAMAATGCATRFESDVHVDTTYDFSRVGSFAFVPARADRSPTENDKILEGAIRKELVSRGYQEVAEADAAVLISYELGVHASARLSGANSFALDKGGITVRVMDPATRRTVWYGWSEKTLTAEDTAEVAIPEAVSALFAERITHAPS